MVTAAASKGFAAKGVYKVFVMISHEGVSATETIATGLFEDVSALTLHF